MTELDIKNRFLKFMYLKLTLKGLHLKVTWLHLKVT